MPDSTNDAVRVPRWQLNLWCSLAETAKQAAGRGDAGGTAIAYGTLVSLCGHLKDAVMVADADARADDKWEQDRAAKRDAERAEVDRWARDYREAHDKAASDARLERLRAANWTVRHLADDAS